jgi:hypothetical protein
MDGRWQVTVVVGSAAVAAVSLVTAKGMAKDGHTMVEASGGGGSSSSCHRCANS